MELRRAIAADLDRLAQLAEPLQRRADRNIVYLATDAPTIAEGITAEDDDWTAVSAVALHGDTVVGWLVGSVDVELGRVWWYGPFVADGDDGSTDWTTVADALYRDAHRRLPDRVDQEEIAVDPAFAELRRWADGLGFVADTGSVALISGFAPRSELSSPPGVEIGPARADDQAAIGPLHDQLFPGAHLLGSRILDTPTEGHRRLVARIDGSPVGYVAIERTPDGEAYIDFVGVDPARRRSGVGAALIGAAMVEGAALGCHRAALTVRTDNDGAIALYRSLGFTQDQELLPLRKGFSLDS